ncbi:MAG: ABC transporter substrate-binding protein, partial [Eubacteriales bacterium]|nr:ABC transporter substrate-binding protein [Eubacteriales bacterium]
MKKTLAIILALVMVLSLGAAAFAEDIGDTLVLYSTMTEKDLDALISGFAEVYPDCEIEVVSGTIGETTSRIAAEADNPQGDVTWGGLADSDGMQYA